MTAPTEEIDSVKIQKILDENAQLIQVITEYQNKGRAQDCIQYQRILHRNLLYLTSVADTNLQSHLIQPSQVANANEDNSNELNQRVQSAPHMTSINNQENPIGKLSQGAMYGQNYTITNASQQSPRNIGSMSHPNSQPGIAQSSSQGPIFKYPVANISQQNISSGHLSNQRNLPSMVQMSSMYKQNSPTTDTSNNMFVASNKVSLASNRENSGPPLSQVQMYEQTFPNSNTSQQVLSSNIVNKSSSQNVDFQQFQFGME